MKSSEDKITETFENYLRVKFLDLKNEIKFDKKIGSFKKGPFHLAKNTNATIVPIALKGGFKAKKKSDWRVQPGILTVVFGEPIESSQFTTLSVKDLGGLVRNRIIELKKRNL